MSLLIRPTAYQVVKAAQNIPQNTTATLFTVSGGAVLVTSLVGLVTTAIGGTAITLSLGNTPTGGANAPTSIATAGTMTSKVVGTLYLPAWSSGVASAPIIANVVSLPVAQSQSFLVPAGVITWTTSANDAWADAVEHQLPAPRHRRDGELT